MDLTAVTQGINFSEVALALFSGTFAIIVAWVAFRGKAEEASAQHIKTLTDGQANRITALENRLGVIEEKLAKTEIALRLESRRSDELREALIRAIGCLDRIDSWVASGSIGDMPRLPDLDYLKRIARNE